MREPLTFAQKLHTEYGDTIELRLACCQHFVFYSITQEGEHFRFKDDSFLLITGGKKARPSDPQPRRLDA